MAGAEVEDDVFGEDPRFRRWRNGSRPCSHEAGLFLRPGRWPTSSGSGCTASPVRGAARRLAGPRRARRAGRGSGAVGRHQPDLVGARGLLDPVAPLSMVVTGVGPYQVCTSLVCVENTHNFGGGTVQPLAALRAVRAATEREGGGDAPRRGPAVERARRLGVPLADYGDCADTVSSA